MPPTLRNPAVQYGFNRTNPKAEAYAKDVAARLITGIADRTAIRDLIYRAFSENRPPASTARMIRAYIGLLPSQAQAVENLRDLMRSSPGKLLYAGKTRIRVPEEGASDELIDQRAEEYADRLLNQRAEMIARTETLAASNEGQRLLWDQAIEDGLLTGGEKRKWLWTEGLDKVPCPLCSAMDGELTGIDEPWTLPDGFESMDGETEVMVPQQVHPHCRCGQGLVTEAQMADQREQDQQAEDEANLETMSERVLGGPGSGNFGHAGRPGEVGGSGEGGETSTGVSFEKDGRWTRQDYPLFKEKVASYRAALAPEEVTAIKAYKGGMFGEINGFLRTGEMPLLSPTPISKIEGYVKSLDKAVRVPVEKDIVVYRGGKLMGGVGSIITDKAFVSTSLVREKAEKFVSMKRDKLLWEITVPKGTHIGLPFGTAPTEFEVLLQRGSQFRITGIEKNVVRAELVR
jgi:hypothetical protein